MRKYAARFTKPERVRGIQQKGGNTDKVCEKLHKKKA
jgi:hypothetical protein